jgi:hypothetical protein
MGRQWNRTLNYYETKEKYDKDTMTTRPEWIKEARPTETKELTEEIFSHILLQVRRPKYEKIERLSDERVEEEIKKGTIGASDLREKSKFGEWVSPLVYQNRKKVKTKTKDKNGKIETVITIVPTNHLRIVDSFQRDNNYQTFILQALWEYDRDEGQALMDKYETKLKRAKLWEHCGWSKEPPPERTNKRKRYDLDGYIELMRAEVEEAEEKITEETLAKTAK